MPDNARWNQERGRIIVCVFNATESMPQRPFRSKPLFAATSSDAVFYRLFICNSQNLI